MAFEDSSERCNRRKSKELRNTVGFPELTQTTTMNLRSSGRTDVAKLHSDTSETTPTTALRIRKVGAAHAKNILVLYTAEEALSLFFETHLTKCQYTKFLSQAKMKNCDIYPSYHVSKAVKEEWYHSKGKIQNYKSLVEVYLHILVDRTASRFIMAQKIPQILFWTTFRKNYFSFQNGVAMEALDTVNTSNVLWKMLVTMISVVPLKLYSTKTSGDKFFGTILGLLWGTVFPPG